MDYSYHCADVYGTGYYDCPEIMWGDRVVFVVTECDTYCDSGVMQIDQFKAYNSLNKIFETSLIEEPPTDSSSINFSQYSAYNPRSTYVSNDGYNQ